MFILQKSYYCIWHKPSVYYRSYGLMSLLVLIYIIVDLGETDAARSFRLSDLKMIFKFQKILEARHGVRDRRNDLLHPSFSIVDDHGE
jgi:hypothetical protein